MAFTSSRVFKVAPNRIPDMAQLLEQELRKDGYETRRDVLLGGDVVVSVTKGGLFKAVVGMKTALKVELRADNGSVLAKTSVGIWGHQIVPTVIMLLWFWPVLITQIWGLVQQSRLDTRVMEILAKAASVPLDIIDVPSEELAPVRFCSECGKPVHGNFCSNCGAKV
ncbi:MAG: zinc ribbon domain-containing protein [Kiritimatiellae bacterium]|nr:zinc ribbon domain-containing protein [Kiritimatiellia bacterium]